MERWTPTILLEDIQKAFEWQLSIPIILQLQKKRLYLIVQTPFKSTKNLGFSKLSMSQYQDFKINALLLQKTKGLDSHHHQLSLSWSPKNGSHDSLSIPINKT
jgi:hypothetical protein